MILEKNFEPFDILLNEHADDGRGGRTSLWSVSGGFSGVAVIGQALHDRARQNSVNAAQEEIPKPLFSVLTRKAVTLPFHAVIRRQRDGKCFRIASEAFDFETPKGGRLDLRAHAAEEFRLPDGASWKPVTPTETEGGTNDQSTGNS